MSIPSPELASFLRQFYGTESQYFYRTGLNEHAIISAVEGIEQGDPAGPALFACGLKAPLDELRERLQALIANDRENEAGYDGDSENDFRSCHSADRARAAADIAADIASKPLCPTPNFIASLRLLFIVCVVRSLWQTTSRELSFTLRCHPSTSLAAAWRCTTAAMRFLQCQIATLFYELK